MRRKLHKLSRNFLSKAGNFRTVIRKKKKDSATNEFCGMIRNILTSYFEEFFMYDWLCISLLDLIIIVIENGHSKTCLTLQGPIPQNGQIHSNNSSATADELFECV